MIDQLWVEKYRPRSIDEIVLNDKIEKQIRNFIENENLPHMIFVGRPGTGKTTLALAIKEHLVKSDDDVLFLNASDNRGINTVRNVILEFLKVPPLVSPIKLVILDEADNLTSESFAALRNPIENKEFNSGGLTRFIFTANYESRIPDYIKSRCLLYRFSYMPIEEMEKRITKILLQEGIEFKDDDVNYIVDLYYPDFRAAINAVQQASSNGILDTEMLSKGAKNVNMEIAEFINKFCETTTGPFSYNDVEPMIHELRAMLKSKLYSPQEVCELLLDKGKLSISEYIIVNRYMNTFQHAVDQDHHLVAMIYEILVHRLKMGRLLQHVQTS